MSRPHPAAVVEDLVNRGLGAALTRAGHVPTVVPHLGYGGADFLRVLARVVLAEPDDDPERTDRRRGWRNFLTAEVVSHPVTVTVQGVSQPGTTDRSGNVDLRLDNPGLPAGRHQVTVTPEGGSPVEVPVLVVDESEEFGLVSDIDDTVLSTWLPRPLLAAYNTFVLTEAARRAVPGMADLYSWLLAQRPGAPTVYVSTGAWNTAPMLRRFMADHRLPEGPMLMTDWGPTNTGWFRSGQDHKRACLRRLAADFPHIRWVLVGDDGQHDPSLYADFARERPELVRAIAIRQLSSGEQVLAHATPVSKPGEDFDQSPLQVPEVRAPDGHALRERLADLAL